MKDKFIVLTHEMIRSKELTMQEKIIYIEILNLSSLEKGCIASNNHFEVSFGISKKSVSNTISSLIKKGYVESKLLDRNHTRILSIKNGQVSIKDGQVSIKNGETKENKTINKTINIDTLFIQYKKQNENASERELNIVMDFIDYRKSIKDKIKTILPVEMYIKELKKLQKLGYKINDCIETMKINEWKTIKTEYIHKPTKNNQSRSEEVMR